MKYFVIAGEASGDLHASNLIKGIKAFDTSAKFSGWGGDLMKAQGVSIQKHISELSFMGFTEVLKNIRTIRKNFKTCYKQIDEFNPDAVILVDFPGFNLRIAKHIFGKVKRVYYYISPTVWAWHRSRMYTVRDYTNKMFVILPFEKNFYARYGIQVEFEGHPLLDVHTLPPISSSHPDSNLISIFPGSRLSEVNAILPVMLEAARELGKNYFFVIGAANNIDDSVYQNIIGDFPVTISREGSHSILLRSCACMAKSGTTTFETALMGVPQVVCYKTSPVSYRIAKSLVSVKWVSLANIILNEPLLTELLQNNFKADILYIEMKKILPGGENRGKLLEGYSRLRGLIGKPGASMRVAEKMYNDLCAAL